MNLREKIEKILEKEYGAYYDDVVDKLLNLHSVICSSRERNPNFKKEVFEKKVQRAMKCGYPRDVAEWKVLGDFNNLFFKSFGNKPNKRKTDIDGYYI